MRFFTPMYGFHQSFISELPALHLKHFANGDKFVKKIALGI